MSCSVGSHTHTHTHTRARAHAQVRKLLEDARVRARHVRKEYNDIFKELQTEKEITEDDLKRYQAKVQESIDACTKLLQGIAADKEKEVVEA